MDRDRLTITLSTSILEKVDGCIDGVNIRNRSHAIEYLITKSLASSVQQAVILAGGKGLNMRPFTIETPKGLLPVGGKPILEHIIDMLARFEIRDIVLSIGHVGEKIQEYFENGKRWGVTITYVQEKEEVGTGGALVLAQKHLTTDTFLVLHGDILTDITLSDLISFHREQESVATIALTSVVDPSSFGEVVLHGSKITKFIEKPEKGKQTSQLINCGIYVVDRKIFDVLPIHGFSLLEDVFPLLAEQKRLAGFLFEGYWIDVGTPASYERAIREWGRRRHVSSGKA